MISRRVLLGTGIGVVVAGGAVLTAGATHRLDDAARAVGLDPRPEPDPGDTALMTRAAKAQAVLLADVVATASQHPTLELAAFEAIGREQLAAIGGSSTARSTSDATSDAGAAATSLAAAYAAAAKARAADAGAAVSPDLARVLASMSAGLSQCARAARSLA